MLWHSLSFRKKTKNKTAFWIHRAIRTHLSLAWFACWELSVDRSWVRFRWQRCSGWTKESHRNTSMEWLLVLTAHASPLWSQAACISILSWSKSGAIHTAQEKTSRDSNELLCLFNSCQVFRMGLAIAQCCVFYEWQLGHGTKKICPHGYALPVLEIWAHQ